MSALLGSLWVVGRIGWPGETWEVSMYDPDWESVQEDMWHDEQPIGCECELDWNCGLHQGSFTAIERDNNRKASEQSDLDRQGGF